MTTKFNPTKEAIMANDIHKKTVLFIDDNALSIEIYKASMKDAPFTCLFCSDPIEAKELLKKKKIDGIVSDLSMPEFSGIDLLKDAKKSQDHCFKYIATGNTDLASIIYAVNEIGIDKVFLKPLQMTGDQLIEMMTQQLKAG